VAYGSERKAERDELMKALGVREYRAAALREAEEDDRAAIGAAFTTPGYRVPGGSERDSGGARR